MLIFQRTFANIRFGRQAGPADSPTGSVGWPGWRLAGLAGWAAWLPVQAGLPCCAGKWDTFSSSWANVRHHWHHGPRSSSQGQWAPSHGQWAPWLGCGRQGLLCLHSARSGSGPLSSAVREASCQLRSLQVHHPGSGRPWPPSSIESSLT